MVQCCSADKHITVAIVGLSLSCCEFILASVYNFHFIGVGLSLICIICSVLYLYFNWKDKTIEEDNPIVAAANSGRSPNNADANRHDDLQALATTDTAAAN